MNMKSMKFNRRKERNVDDDERQRVSFPQNIADHFQTFSNIISILH